MGVMSRRVVPVCGNLCFFCPALRARSRQPVKRYKKLLADIFPRSQDAEPNDRKIAKLCEYASRNPLRIPKITNYLEHRFYKDLRNEHIGSVKVVLCVYRKLLSSCKEQMPLFASSLLGIIDILLDQNRWSEFQVLGCSALVDFINFQIDSTYMFNLETSIPKLCQLAQEVGDNDRAVCLRAAGLQALASMVHFMGEHSHISKDFDKIISVTLENYMDLNAKPQGGKLDGHGSQTQDQKIQGVVKVESENSSTELHIKIENGKLEPPLDASRSPSYWSKVCLHNMAGLAKEATTVRRVLEPFFHNFDSEDYWSLEKGLAFSVMMYLQLLLEDAGENSHLLLSILIKHLDHKNVVKQPLKQINIINVTTQLAKSAKQQASVAITGAITDLMKHLRKCIQYSAEASISGDGAGKLNADLQTAVENCILQLSFKVGDVGPILDMMAVVLENLPVSPIVARTTVFSVYRTTQIISSIPNVSYHKKAFPDALFHQLLLAMTHPDHETRVGAHYVFCTVLMPTLICPWLGEDPIHEISLEVSSVDAPQETRNGTVATTVERQDNSETKGSVETRPAVDYEVKQAITCQSLRKSCSFSGAMTCEKKDLASLRLSGHQIGLLLSSIWVQAMSPENTPANFEAISHTFNIALLFTRSKTSSHAALVRCFQLALTLRSSSFDQEGGLQPSRRRSLFTLASYMLIFSARAGNLPELIPVAKSYLTDKTVDPYLEPVEDIRLQAVSTDFRCYGTEEDDAAAWESLSEINADDQQLKEVVISSLMSRFDKLTEDELFGIKMQLLQGFSLDDAYPLGAALFMETPKPCSPPAEMEMQAFEESLAPSILSDEAAGDDASGSRSGQETSLCVNSLDVLSVNQLLESVLDTARQVASLPASNAPRPYDEVKSQCEALVTGKQQKMSVLHSMKQQQETKAIVVSCDGSVKSNPPPTAVKSEGSELDLGMTGKDSNPIQFHDKLLLCSLEYGQQQSFRLPPSSPYDKFLKAAGC